jgi:23S rRNA (cytidine1920-2'-O)/16S rRNA (cytidine1409-2'-O)-methyltransferase
LADRGGRRTRVDVALVEAGLVESRQKAQALILAGKVKVGGETVREPARPVLPGAVELVAGPRYVSRGGEKLAPALDAFGVDPAGRVAADLGASTGGFTDVLLQRGAVRVYAVDVGRGLIHERLRGDPRVVLMERVNARLLEPFPEPVTLLTADLSFIGLEKVLPAVRRAAPALEAAVVLFKPQFEVGPGEVGKGGVVRDPAHVERALAGFATWCEANGWRLVGRFPSPIAGPAGNREILLHLVPAP